MKVYKIIGILFILLFNLSHVYADIMVLGSNCYKYNEYCYNNCLKNNNREGLCKAKCCIEEKKYCTDKECLDECYKAGHLTVYCPKWCHYVCNEGEILKRNREYTIKSLIYFSIFFISILGILYFFKKIKNNKLG